MAGADGVVAELKRVYGLHAAQTVLARRPHDVVRALILDGTPNPRLAELVRTLHARGIEAETRARGELDKLSGRGAHQGIVLEVRAPSGVSIVEFEDLVVERGRALRLLVLDRVEDPRNLGACLRTADAAGVHAVVVPKAHSAKLGPAAVKAAAGAAETVPLVVVANLARTLDWLKRAGVWVVGADGSARHSLHEAKLETPIAIVLGAEGRGLRRLTRESCDELVSLPMHGSVDSLNVSVAAGVVLYELLRQAPPDKA